MDRKQLSVILFLIILLTAYLAVPLLPDRSSPKAAHGVLDLRSWSFADGSIRLDGEWEWFPDRLIAAEPSATPLTDRFIHVPGKWDKSFEPNQTSAFGAGSYRLRVLLPDDAPSYLALRVTNIRTSHELFVNGRSIGSSGKPALLPEQSIPRNHAYVAGTEISGREMDIVVHVANFSYYTGGGFFQPVWLGSMESISLIKSLSTGADMTAAIVFGTIGLLSALTCILFYRHRELLVFALLNISIMQYVLTHGEKLLYVLFPKLDYVWMTKIQLFTTVQIVSCILSLMSLLVISKRGREVGKALQLLCAVIALALLVLPVEPFTRGFYTLAVTTASYLYIYYTLFQAIWNKHRHSFFIMISTLGTIAATVNQLMMEADVRKPLFDPSIEYIVFMVGLVMLLFDTYVKALDDATELSKSLIRSDQRSKEFLANTSFELRTPIHTLLNVSHTLLLEGRQDFTARQRQEVKTIEAIGRRMSRLLDDMVDLAAASEGKLQILAERIYVRPVVSASADMLRLLLNDKPVRIVNLVPADVVVLADEGRLVQMMTHLLSSAILRLSSGTITVTAERIDNDVHITVDYTGSFGKDEPAAAWEQAAVAGEDREEKPGERIMKRLAQLQGGAMEATASGSEGTEYRLTLPAALFDELSDYRSLPAQSQPNRSGNGDILIVAEPSLHLQMMVKLLKAEHYAVTALTDPRKAIDLLHGHFTFDLVLLDVSLPTMSGYELCRRIRQRFSGTELPILLVTAHGRAEDAAAAFDAGANDYIRKPIDPIESSARIRGAMQLRKSIEERIQLELALVQAQLKPHFLYNTLNTIAALSEIDHDRTRELLMHFGDYLRASFDKRNLEPLVPFAKELELVRNYLHIEQIRFGERLKVEYAGVDGARFMIPPLTLQPLVENAIRHGLMKKVRGGTLRIEIDARAPDAVIVAVIDDGVGIEEERIGPLLEGAGEGGIGLYNTHKRLLHMFGQGLLIRRNPEGGTEIRMRIPK